MVTQEKFDLLVDIVQDMSKVLTQLNQRIENLEEIARHHENQICELRDEVKRLNGIVDT